MRKLLITIFFTTFIVGCDNNITKKEIQSYIQVDYNNPPKVISFKNIDNLIKTLSSKSSLTFSKWNELKFSDESKKWSSDTPILEFGKYSKNGFQNNIVYTILGKEKEHCNELQIILNIKNPEQIEKAFSHFLFSVEQTLAKLKIKFPQTLAKNIRDRKQFAEENEYSYIILRKQESTEINYNIHHEKKLDKKITFQSWKLIIKSK